jgi:pimeloyl-ACP methyl ester carboxylesterase
MSIATVDNQLIHYEALGRGQPLLFVHGWLGSWRYWWPSMQALSAGQRSFALDLWGFGDSSKTPSLYNLASYVTMIEQFIDKMGVVQPITLIGHSLGAAVALRYTRKNPDMVKKLVAVALPLQGESINPRLTNTEPDSFVSKVLGKANNFAEIDSELRKTDPQAMNQLAKELGSSNFLQEVAECPRPVLLVYGGQDQVVQIPPHQYDQLQNTGNNRFFVPLDDCNHFPMLQEKAKFNRLLLDFIHADERVTELAPKDHWQRRVR